MLTLYRATTSNQTIGSVSDADKIIFQIDTSGNERNGSVVLTSINGKISRYNPTHENPGTDQVRNPDTGVQGRTVILNCIFEQEVGDTANTELLKIIDWINSSQSVDGVLRARVGLIYPQGSMYNITPTLENGYKIIDIEPEQIVNNRGPVITKITLMRSGINVG